MSHKKLISVRDFRRKPRKWAATWYPSILRFLYVHENEHFNNLFLMVLTVTFALFPVAVEDLSIWTLPVPEWEMHILFPFSLRVDYRTPRPTSVWCWCSSMIGQKRYRYPKAGFLTDPLSKMSCFSVLRKYRSRESYWLLYLAKFASPKMQKVAYLGQESDWVPSKCLVKIHISWYGSSTTHAVQLSQKPQYQLWQGPRNLGQQLSLQLKKGDWFVQSYLENDYSWPVLLTTWATVQVQQLHSHHSMEQVCHFYSVLTAEGRSEFYHGYRNQEENQRKFHPSVIITNQMCLLLHLDKAVHAHYHQRV